MRRLAFALSVLVAVAASACGRSYRAPERDAAGGAGGSNGGGVSGASDAGDGGSNGGSNGGGAGGASGHVAGGSGGGGSSGASGGGAGGSSGSGTSGGGAGAAGAPLTDAEVCADACAQTDHPLPSALCEDWRYPDEEHVAEYCVPVETRECTERCEQQLAVVSPACNAALRRTLPCVARTNLYQEEVITSSPCIFEECTGLLLRLPAECNGLRQELSSAKKLWANAGSDSYSFEWSTGSTVYEIVVQDGVASLVEGFPADVPTIPELFDRIEQSLEFAPPSVTYDPVLGYPSRAVASAPNCEGGQEVVFSFTVTGLVLE